MIDASGVNRRSFATSTASSSDISSPLTTSANAPQSFGTVPLSQSQLTEPSNIPSVDGIAAGRATALGALCRIVCSKPSTERLNDDQLAQFLCVLHDALIQRDRLVLCSLIFHSTELFKLGLRGVEMLFPNFAMAIDLVLTESFKLRLNPSIHEIDMRHACLRAMASIISWPTTFGTQQVISPNVSPRLHQGTQNLLEPGACYLEVRSRFIKNLVHTLRNETDSMNLQLALALSCQMCFECTLYDLQPQPVPSTPPAANKERKNSTLSASDDNSPFVVSALKRVVSAICDNLCKPQWASELATILAVFDFLNAIASQPKKVLFHNMELSIGSLIISSLCRFVNAQLQKPPPLHSKDLHSSVVAAFHCLEVWLCAAPMLCEMESCIATVAETIEFGMSGGKALAPEDFKPASQRVFDAAENLQQTLFSSSAMDSFVDEESVLKKLGDENLSLDRFQHFLVDKSTLLSLHDITELDFISKGLPTLVMISRTPYRSAHASLIQLRSASHENKENLKNDSSPKTPTSTSAASLQSSGLQTNSQPPVVQSARKRFDFPREIMKPQCKLDEEMHKQVGESKEVAQVEAKLHEIRERLASGSGCAIGNRDASNVWIQSSLGELLCQPPTPEECVRRCNSIRIFLYDMGLINRAIYGNDLIALDISANVSDYYTHLHQLVDRQPAKRCESVSLFYVRQGQHQPSEILQNGDNLATLDPDFCQLVASLGRVRDTRRSSFWTGHWSTAFDAKLKAGGEENGEKASGYKLDGLENCLWWSDSQMEISYTLPTERSANHHLQFMSESGKEDALSNSVLKTQQQTPRYTPSSTSSSLAPASRTGSSLTGETGTANKPDISQHPTSPAVRTRSTSTLNSESSGSQAQKQAQPIGPQNIDRQSQLNQAVNAPNVRRSADQRILVVWLERIEDMTQFPYEQLLPATDDGSQRFATKIQRSDLHILFVHNFERGLVRVNVESVWTKTGQTGPLVDGVVVSTSALPTLLRQTVANIARRKAVEVDQPTNSYRRRQSILELSKKFANPIGYTEFLDRFINV
ncbi:Ral GTPase-activating protein subunit beta [Aphelenchoides bicaudatus]|nr:Ral GTPase-activating protein subunit beta [Aphelenchoides bicaudatus]